MIFEGSLLFDNFDFTFVCGRKFPFTPCSIHQFDSVWMTLASYSAPEVTYWIQVTGHDLAQCHEKQMANPGVLWCRSVSPSAG